MSELTKQGTEMIEEISLDEKESPLQNRKNPRRELEMETESTQDGDSELNSMGTKQAYTASKDNQQLRVIVVFLVAAINYGK
jgi:hypothetical protein